jgi:protein-S-isoprenylcysteine O-methyltransferase Ste14
LLMLGFTPLALGSYWGLLVIVPMIGGLAWRLIDEERFLARELPGYSEYCRTVRYRLIPGIW